MHGSSLDGLLPSELKNVVPGAGRSWQLTTIGKSHSAPAGSVGRYPTRTTPCPGSAAQPPPTERSRRRRQPTAATAPSFTFITKGAPSMSSSTIWHAPTMGGAANNRLTSHSFPGMHSTGRNSAIVIASAPTGPGCASRSAHQEPGQSRQDPHATDQPMPSSHQAQHSPRRSAYVTTTSTCRPDGQVSAPARRPPIRLDDAAEDAGHSSFTRRPFDLSNLVAMSIRRPTTFGTRIDAVPDDFDAAVGAAAASPTPIVRARRRAPRSRLPSSCFSLW